MGEVEGNRLRRRAEPAAARVQTLIAHAKAGDRDAVAELYVLHVDRVYRFLQARTGNRHDAEDLTTQTFVKMLESIGGYDWRSVPFSIWLFRIAHNASIDHFRASRRASPVEHVPESGTSASAEEQTLGSLSASGLLESAETLSADQRKVLALKFLYSFSNLETAAILGKTEGSVKSLQHRALDALAHRVRPARPSPRPLPRRAAASA